LANIRAEIWRLDIVGLRPIYSRKEEVSGERCDARLDGGGERDDRRPFVL
jgi:hypothetical protein